VFGAVIFSLILGHDIVTTKITWAREISRIVQQRCASCHRAGGSAPFALATYDEARPWARSIAEEVLERRMPPWNPVKGFGQFRHEAGLSQEEIGLIADWVEGGAPRGDPRYLPPAALPAPVARTVAGLRVPVAGQLVFAKPLTARGIAVTRMAEGAAGLGRVAGRLNGALARNCSLSFGRQPAVRIPDATRTSGRYPAAPRRNGDSSVDQFRRFTGTSKCAVRTWPDCWICSHTRCTPGRGKITLNCRWPRSG